MWSAGEPIQQPHPADQQKQRNDGVLDHGRHQIQTAQPTAVNSLGRIKKYVDKGRCNHCQSDVQNDLRQPIRQLEFQ